MEVMNLDTTIVPGGESWIAYTVAWLSQTAWTNNKPVVNLAQGRYVWPTQQNNVGLNIPKAFSQLRLRAGNERLGFDFYIVGPKTG